MKWIYMQITGNVCQTNNSLWKWFVSFHFLLYFGKRQFEKKEKEKNTSLNFHASEVYVGW